MVAALHPDGNALPADGNALPADGNALPADGNALPADGYAQSSAARTEYADSRSVARRWSLRYSR